MYLSRVAIKATPARRDETCDRTRRIHGCDRVPEWQQGLQPFDSPAHASQANAVQRSMDKGWTRGFLNNESLVEWARMPRGAEKQ